MKKGTIPKRVPWYEVDIHQSGNGNYGTIHTSETRRAGQEKRPRRGKKGTIGGGTSPDALRRASKARRRQEGARKR